MTTYAYAPISKRTGKILRDLSGHYGIYTTRKKAQEDCPSYGKVERVRVAIVKQSAKS